MVNNMLLSLKNLQFRYPKAERSVLNIPEFSMRAGEKVFLQGASGSGKSTLLGLIAGVLAPQVGEIQLLGQRLDKLSAGKRDQFRAEHIGLVFQLFNLLPYFNLLDNVLLSARFSKRRAAKAAAQSGSVEKSARVLLEALGLGDAMHRSRVDQLSVGQQQRVAVARALLGSPELLICDEPTSAIDSNARENFMKLVFEQADRAGSAILFVSHDAALAPRFDRQLDLAQINLAAAAVQS